MLLLTGEVVRARVLQEPREYALHVCEARLRTYVRQVSRAGYQHGQRRSEQKRNDGEEGTHSHLR